MAVRTTTSSLPLVNSAPAVAVHIGSSHPSEMLDRIRKTHMYLLETVSKQVDDELVGFKRSVYRLNSNLDGYSPVAKIERWKRSIKACLTRCQSTLERLEKWVKREMNAWKTVFGRFEKRIVRSESTLCRSCQLEESKKPLPGMEDVDKKAGELMHQKLSLMAAPPSTPPPCHEHRWVVISVDVPIVPEFDADMSEDPREFLGNLEKYFKARGWHEKLWLSQVEYHMRGAAKKWWEYRQETVKNWQDFKKIFLQYCERLLVREAIRRDLDLPQRRWEPLDQFVWRKRALYLRLYVDANEEDMVKFIMSTVHPEIRRYLKPPLPMTLEELVQRGQEVQLDFDVSDEKPVEEDVPTDHPADAAQYALEATLPADPSGNSGSYVETA
ncbi:activity-regulated cytoskeleton-associated protein [Rhinatrema bivittatum]|uniref:activity-regulated cytoskeleton-associated protein n=1 Tax=Rhinatrema bivittatum TaxID=194408 RepID=UPI00112C50E2|nr:activity-regulated cytoskeleton-associated protein [Rhinatrema bivittatum]